MFHSDRQAVRSVILSRTADENKFYCFHVFAIKYVHVTRGNYLLKTETESRIIRNRDATCTVFLNFYIYVTFLFLVKCGILHASELFTLYIYTPSTRCDIESSRIQAASKGFYTVSHFGNCGSIFIIIFSLRRKLELKQPPPLNSVATLPCEKCAFNYTTSQHSWFASK